MVPNPSSGSGAQVLVVDDDPDLRDILRSILESHGCRVIEAADGQVALSAIHERPPDLILLDWNMPRMTGEELCQILRRDVLLRNIPIIMLTARSEVQQKVHGLNAGVDDYVVKPFEPEELMARVHMVMRRSSQQLDANPLTRLPGNQSIHAELERRIATREPLAVGYIDLDRFKAYNDHLGFARGDEVIRRTAGILLEASREHGSPQDFVGHIGGDDFILITTTERAPQVCRAIVERFDAMVPQLYDEADRARGHLLRSDRKGRMVKIPLLSISVALVTNEDQALTHPGQIAERGAELKAYAKQFERSVFVTERRKVE